MKQESRKMNVLKYVDQGLVQKRKRSKRATAIGLICQRINETNKKTVDVSVSIRLLADLFIEAAARGSDIEIFHMPDIGGGPREIVVLSDPFFGRHHFRINKKLRGNSFLIT